MVKYSKWLKRLRCNIRPPRITRSPTGWSKDNEAGLVTFMRSPTGERLLRSYEYSIFEHIFRTGPMTERDDGVRIGMCMFYHHLLECAGIAVPEDSNNKEEMDSEN